jgi:hypothetical protein
MSVGVTKDYKYEFCLKDLKLKMNFNYELEHLRWTGGVGGGGGISPA